MASQKKTIGFSTWLRTSLIRIARVHYVLLIAYALQTIVMDAWHVIVPQIVLQRWIALGLLLVVTALVWYLAHNQNNDVPTYKRLIFALIISDIAMAAFNVYIERGMASRAALMFAIPIAVSSILLSRSAVYAVAACSTAAYTVAAISYFVLNFNEGYKTELYAVTGFYAAVFFVIAGVLSAIIQFSGNASDR
jgi:hypothetical protein